MNAVVFAMLAWGEDVLQLELGRVVNKWLMVAGVLRADRVVLRPGSAGLMNRAVLSGLHRSVRQHVPRQCWVDLHRPALPTDVFSEVCEIINVDPDELVDRGYQRLMKEIDPYHAEPLRMVNENLSEPHGEFNPEKFGLASMRGNLDGDNDFD